MAEPSGWFSRRAQTSPAWVSIAVQRQVAFLFDALADLGLVAGEHHQINVAPGLRGRLPAGEERDLRRPAIQVGISVVPLPNHVLPRAPGPGDFLLQSLAEGPDLHVVPRPVQPIHADPTGLLDLHSELRLEAIDRLVADEDQVPAGIRDVDPDRGHGLVALLRSTEECLAREERVGKRARKIVLAPGPGLPAGLLHGKLLGLAKDRAVRGRRDRLPAAVFRRRDRPFGRNRRGPSQHKNPQSQRTFHSHAHGLLLCQEDSRSRSSPRGTYSNPKFFKFIIVRTGEDITVAPRTSRR